MIERLPVTPGGPTCRCVTAHSPAIHVLEQHHIWPQGHGGPTVAGNLAALCGSAHNEVHAYLNALLKADGDRPADWRTWNLHIRRVAELGYRRIKAGALVD